MAGHFRLILFMTASLCVSSCGFVEFPAFERWMHSEPTPVATPQQAETGQPIWGNPDAPSIAAAPAPPVQDPTPIMPQRQKTDSTMPPQISEQAETRSIEPPSPIIPAPKVMASTPDARIARLENDIAELRVDVDRLLSLAQGNPALRTSLTGTALTRDQMPQTSPPSVQAGSSQLVNIRTGEHPGKTRLVMDTTAPAQFRTALDNNERILVIELPNTTFTKPLSGQLSKSPYVARYVAEAMGNGSRVIVELKQPARIVKQMVLTPTGPNGHRVMVDLGPA